jgi:hypothetical protein
LSEVDPGKVTVRGRKVRLRLLEPLKQGKALRTTPGVEQDQSLVGLDRNRLRIQCSSPIDLLYRLGKLGHLQKKGCIPVMRDGAAGSERDGPPELAPCGHGIVKPVEIGKRKRQMRVGQRWVERNRTICGRLRARERVVRRHRRVFTQEFIALGEPRIGLRVLRVAHDGLREVVHRMPQSRRCPALPFEQAGAVERERLFRWRMG